MYYVWHHLHSRQQPSGAALEAPDDSAEKYGALHDTTTYIAFKVKANRLLKKIQQAPSPIQEATGLLACIIMIYPITERHDDAPQCDGCSGKSRRKKDEICG